MSGALANFRRLASGLQVRAVSDELAARPDLWRLITVRQAYAGTAHADTESIILRGPTSLEGLFDNLDAVDFAQLTELSATLELLRRVVSLIEAREIGRVMLTRLKAGGQILPHRDEGAYARFYARFHVPIVTSPACVFHCGEESVHMEESELWWFNHQVQHRVDNTDGADRVHLILDATAPGFTGALAA